MAFARAMKILPFATPPPLQVTYFSLPKCKDQATEAKAFKILTLELISFLLSTPQSTSGCSFYVCKCESWNIYIYIFFFSPSLRLLGHQNRWLLRWVFLLPHGRSCPNVGSFLRRGPSPR